MVLGVAPISELAGVDWASLFAPKAEADGKTYKVGDIIEFGSYPQSKVTDSSLVSALNKASKKWVSYGYYSGNGSYDIMVQGDWMEYADFTYNGTKYRAVTFSQYRPYRTSAVFSSGNSYQDNNGYTTNNTYYFKYESLKWRVLDHSTGLALCESIIDSQAYSDTAYSYERDPYGYTAYWNDAAHTHYANDYATSSIRAWLNDDFYNTAFSSSQKASILTSELDNKAYSTSYSEYDSETTYDKVFLLSWSEMQNTAYGFTANTRSSSTRQAKGTDYAKCQGLWVGSSNEYSIQRLRSAGEGSDYACVVVSDGNLDYDWDVRHTYYGVRPAIKISNLGSITNNTATSAPDSSDPVTSNSNSKSDTSRHFPKGYKFEEDSYDFSNYGDTISKKYFTTLYGAEKGKLLYKKYHKQGGLCFGMAYTTAAIYNGYPSCSQISTLDKGLFKYKYCENIRDILNNKVQRLSDPTMDKTLISSKLPIGENVIGIEDYIKYAFVYQFSKTVSDTSVWCDNANVILDLAKQYTDENKIGLTIGITGKDKGMGGHRVLVVGYEGNDILVDDPNKTSGWNRITVNPDGSWTFGNADNNSYYIRYNVDYQRPFELLKSGKTETADEEFLDNTAAGETYVEDIDTLDKESKLLAVDSDSYDLDEKKFSAVYLESGDGQSVNAYWTDKTTASIKNINGGNRAVEFAGNGYIISAIVADSSDVDMTLNKNKFKTQVNSKKGSECTISVDACREDDSNNDISKKIEIVGTATDGEVTVERINKGIRVLGIENGTVNYYIDDNMVSTEKTDGNGDFFDIKYDAQGEDDTLQIKKVKFSKLRKFLKKIFKAIAKPFKALARYIKKLFSK
ncbi:MAG: DUF6273 domain-containing protein [Acutalibacteraceae bacterium]|nr:DUF6273 domain-containing protein [Acutalibacteraceae bacterium]